MPLEKNQDGPWHSQRIIRLEFLDYPICLTENSIFLSFGLLYHQKIISNYVDEEISYGELSIRNSDLIDEIKGLNKENEMLVGLMKTEKEKFKNEMIIQQENSRSELLVAKDLQRNLQGPAQIWDPSDGPFRAVLVDQKFWFIHITSLSVIL